MIFLSFIISSRLILPICFKIAPLTFFFHSISYIFFHCHMDRDHLDTLSSLLQSAAESPFVPFCQNFMCIFIGLYTAVPCSVTPAYIFFHHRADFLSLHHKFLLLQSHLFFFRLSRRISCIDQFVIRFLCYRRIIFSYLYNSLSVNLSSIK